MFVGHICTVHKTHGNDNAQNFTLALLNEHSDADPDLWILICKIKVGSGSVRRDTNPGPGHIR